MIWQEEKYRSLQGTYPVISLSFAKVKQTSYESARKMIGYIITSLYNQYDVLLDSDKLNEREKEFCRKISADMEEDIAMNTYMNRVTTEMFSYIDVSCEAIPVSGRRREA